MNVMLMIAGVLGIILGLFAIIFKKINSHSILIPNFFAKRMISVNEIHGEKTGANISFWMGVLLFCMGVFFLILGIFTNPV